MATLIIFGAHSDLAKNYLYPALSKLEKTHTHLSILAVGRREQTQAEFEEWAGKSSPLPRRIAYFQADFEKEESYRSILQAAADLGGPKGRAGDLFLHFSISPAMFGTVLGGLKSANIREEWQGRKRLLIEKPFGFNEESSRDLHKQLLECFAEEEIYRIDHYLGKETLRNILTFRFANAFTEPIWNRDHLDHIQITVAESKGLDLRGKTYDATGAVRDVLQNHALQLLALLIMPKPQSWRSEDVALAKEEALSSLGVGGRVVAGQYEGFKDEPDVADGSQTETYIMAELYSDLPDMRDVPLYIRTGKALRRKITEITLQFKTRHADLFPNQELPPSILTLRVQPDEGIDWQMLIKHPGKKQALQRLNLEFCYPQEGEAALPTAYEVVYDDAFSGDDALRLTQEEVVASWKVADALRERIRAEGPVTYPRTSWGPDAADEALAGQGRVWYAHTSKVCNAVTTED